jgi:uncharacterized protein YfdQ (DUF2303 family)
MDGNPWEKALLDYLPDNARDLTATSHATIDAIMAVGYEVARHRLVMEKLLAVANQIRSDIEQARRTHK